MNINDLTNNYMKQNQEKKLSNKAKNIKPE